MTGIIFYASNKLSDQAKKEADKIKTDVLLWGRVSRQSLRFRGLEWSDVVNTFNCTFIYRMPQMQ